MVYQIILFLIIFLFNFINIIQTGTVEELAPHSKYLNDEYASFFQISPSIMTIFANGGERQTHELSKAFDNDFNTQWFSQGQQGMEYTNPITGITYESLVNNLIITFNTTVNIDKMIYKTDNCNGCEGIGYPTHLKIYIKIKSNPNEQLNPYEDSNFILIEDIISEASKNIVLFTFDQTLICDQLKLEWADIKTYPNYEKFTTAKEIKFLLPETEYLNETILNIFSKNDYTQMTLSEEFNNINILEEIIEKSENYIKINENINSVLKRAKYALSGALKFDEKREFTTNQKAKKNVIQQRGNVASHARNVIKMVWTGTNRQSLGIYALANETITFYVTGENNDPMPSIRFTQYIGLYSNWLGKEFILKKGKQTYTYNNFDVSSYNIKVISGGPMYISNPYTNDEQSQNIKIYIEGGTIFPIYKLNENEEEYKAFLSQYVLMYKNHTDSYFDITEFIGYRTMITVPATSAYDIYENQKKSPLENLNTWDSYIKELFIYDGVQYEKSQPYYDIKNTYINLHIRYAQPYGAAYAYTEHIGIFEDWIKTATFANGYGWGFAHEIGHMMDISERTVSETTNNMISKYEESFRERNGQRGEFEKSLKALTLDDIDVNERGCTSDTCNGFFRNLELNFLIWWYLESFFPGYWGKLDNMYRYDYSLSTEMTYTERFIFFSNIITGINLGYYFYRWGFYLNNEGFFIEENASSKYKEKMEEYINNGKINNKIQYKFWYIDYKEYLYILEGGQGCYESNNKYDIQIEKVFYINNTQTILLLPKIYCSGHLGFEIYEHDKLIGFTYGTIFTDSNVYVEDYIQEYKIIAYDRKLIPSKESNIKGREISSEVCYFQSDMYNSIKEAVEKAESLDTDEDLNIYLLKDTYESSIAINKKINIYLSDNVNNIIIYKVGENALFDIKEGGTLLIQGKDENNKIILDGLNITNKGSLIYTNRGTFKGNYLIFRNNYNSEVQGGAIFGISCTLEIQNSLIKNNYAQRGGGLCSELNGIPLVANFTNVIFENNKASNGASIANSGKVILNNCEIKNCYSTNNGGGISNDGGGELIINGGKIINNIADNMGGGLFLDGKTNLASVEISGNTAKFGGGITFSGSNDARTFYLESGKITNNNAKLYGGGIYMQKGLSHLNGGEIFNNKINNTNGLSASNFSDALFIENGNTNIGGIKFDGIIFKSDSANIKLKSSLVKYTDNSKIYIDFINNGYNKTLLSGDNNYCITSEDLNKINIINSNIGNLKLNSLEEKGNSVIFIPKILTITFNSHKKISLISLIEENEEEQGEIYYYGKEIILSHEHFPINENEYITRIYDQKGKDYKIGQKIIVVEDLQFYYDISYKNKIVLDFVDYKENKLIIPDEYIYLPSYRNDYSTEKYILKWRDIKTNEIFEKSEKIQGNKNRTILAIYITIDYFSVKIILFKKDILSGFLNYDEIINFPEVNVPKGNHFKGWIDKISNKTYDTNLKTMNVKKDYCFTAIIVSYIKYYLDNELIETKEYDVNSTFILLEKEKIPEKKVTHWVDKKNNIKYYYDKEYIVNSDIDLYAVYVKKEGSNAALIVIIIIAIILLVVGVFLTYRYIRRSNIENKIEEIPKGTTLTPTS